MTSPPKRAGGRTAVNIFGRLQVIGVCAPRLAPASGLRAVNRRFPADSAHAPPIVPARHPKAVLKHTHSRRWRDG